jgi:hypothetical protein
MPHQVETSSETLCAVVSFFQELVAYINTLINTALDRRINRSFWSQRNPSRLDCAAAPRPVISRLTGGRIWGFERQSRPTLGRVWAYLDRWSGALVTIRYRCAGASLARSLTCLESRARQ